MRFGRPPDLLHHRVASVDTEAAANAFQLHAVAYVDPRRTHGDATETVDAIAAPFPAVAGLVLAARLAAPAAIADRQSLIVEHRRLEARPRAHIGADLLARPSSQQIGRCGEQADEEISGDFRLSGQELADESRRVDVVHDPCAAGRERDQNPMSCFAVFRQTRLKVLGPSSSRLR